MTSSGDILQELRRLMDDPDRLAPWTGLDRFPWGDPAFSERMLQVHLDPETDQASRRPEVIAAHVEWLLGQLSRPKQGGPRPLHILDAGCGPGLYCHELARRGHLATGLDIAPAALRWAEEHAAAEGLSCRFLQQDLDDLPEDLPAVVAAGHGPADAVTFWFGDFHGFRADRAERMLQILARCLRPGGLLVLEHQPLADFVREPGSSWEIGDASPLYEGPHLWLQEYDYDGQTRTEIHGHWIIPLDSGKLLRYRQCHQGWSDRDLDRLLSRCGLRGPERHPPITGVDPELEFPVLTARRLAAERDDDRA